MLGKDFKKTKCKAQTAKKLINKIICKLGTLIYQKNLIKMKRQATKWEKIFATYTNIKILMSYIVKEKKNYSDRKMGKRLEQEPSKR